MPSIVAALALIDPQVKRRKGWESTGCLLLHGLDRPVQTTVQIF